MLVTVLLTKRAYELTLIVVKQVLLDEEQRQDNGGSDTHKGDATLKSSYEDTQAWCLLQMWAGWSLPKRLPQTALKIQATAALTKSLSVHWQASC